MMACWGGSSGDNESGVVRKSKAMTPYEPAEELPFAIQTTKSNISNTIGPPCHANNYSTELEKKRLQDCTSPIPGLWASSDLSYEPAFHLEGASAETRQAVAEAIRQQYLDAAASLLAPGQDLERNFGPYSKSRSWAPDIDFTSPPVQPRPTMNQSVAFSTLMEHAEMEAQPLEKHGRIVSMESASLDGTMSHLSGTIDEGKEDDVEPTATGCGVGCNPFAYQHNVLSRVEPPPSRRDFRFNTAEGIDRPPMKSDEEVSTPGLVSSFHSMGDKLVDRQMHGWKKSNAGSHAIKEAPSDESGVASPPPPTTATASSRWVDCNPCGGGAVRKHVTDDDADDEIMEPPARARSGVASRPPPTTTTTTPSSRWVNCNPCGGGAVREHVTDNDADDEIMEPPARARALVQESFDQSSVGWAPGRTIVPASRTGDFGRTRRRGVKQSRERLMASLAGASAVMSGDHAFEVSVDLVTTCSTGDVMDILGNIDLLRCWCDPVTDVMVTKSSEVASRRTGKSHREYDGEWVEATTPQLVPPVNTSCLYSAGRMLSVAFGFPTYGKIAMFIERQRGRVGITVGPFPGDIEALHKIKVVRLDAHRVRIVDRVKLRHEEVDIFSFNGYFEKVEKLFLPTTDDYMDQTLSSMARLRFLIENGVAHTASLSNLDGALDAPLLRDMHEH